MKITSSLLVLTMVFAVGCSSGGSNGDGNNDGTASGEGTVLTLDNSMLPSAADYPSNAELAATNGTPEIEDARILIQGKWNSTDDATQCVTTFEFDGFLFATSSLDHRGTGLYSLFDDDGAIELDLNFESENFQTNCLGQIEDGDALDPGVSFGWGITFPDQNTMVFSSGVGFGFGFDVYVFTRQ